MSLANFSKKRGRLLYKAPSAVVPAVVAVLELPDDQELDEPAKEHSNIEHVFEF